MKFKTKEQEKRYNDMVELWESFIKIQQEGKTIFFKEKGEEPQSCGEFKIDKGLLVCGGCVYVGWIFVESELGSDDYDCVYVDYTPHRFRVIHKPHVIERVRYL